MIHLLGDALTWVFLTTGFTVGFGHCIGICRPIVISLSLNLKAGNRSADLFFQGIWVPCCIKTNPDLLSPGPDLGLLPNDPVYTVLIASARAGMDAPDIYTGFIKGMVLMLSFGMGTLPALFAVGRLAGAAFCPGCINIIRLFSFS